MMYIVEVTTPENRSTVSNGVYSREVAMILARNLIERECVNFGNGFWTRTGVYVGRIVPQERIEK